jgi:uncharacterized protein (TIGR02147 family)
MSPEMKPIFTFTNYRDFIREYFVERKKASPSFSHRLFARLAGFSTSNFMHLVMGGKRNLTKESIDKISQAMKLKKRERDYFEHLVLFGQAKTVREKELYLSRLNTMRKGAFYKEIGSDQFEYIANWLHPVVRELVSLTAACGDEKELTNRIAHRVTPAQVRESIELLLRLGLLQRSKAGKLSPSSPLLSTGPGVTANAAARYHIGTMALAAEAIERFRPEERELVGMTLGVSKKTFEQIRERMWEFRQEVLAMADDPAPEQVYQLNIQLFPMTKSNRSAGAF